MSNMVGSLATRLAKGAVFAASIMASSCLLSQSGQAQDSVTWRVQSHWPRASTSFDDSLGRLKNVIEERTDGRLKLELHEGGSLFGYDEIFPAVQRGIIQMGTLSPAYLLDEVETAGIAYGLPSSFRNVWEAVYFFKHMGFEEMIRDEVAEYGVFYATDKVYPTEMVLKEPVENMEQFQALNIRSSGALQTYLTESGAAASMIPGEELYQALSSGVVDGAHWGAVQGALSMSLYEVAPYHVRPPLSIGGVDAFVINQQALDDLPEDVRQIVFDALEEQFWMRTNEYLFLEQQALAKAKEELDVEVINLPEDVQARMQEAAQTLWDREGEKGPKAAEALEMVRDLLTQLGYI